MKVYIASDHAGFELKDALKAFLYERNVNIEDLGPTVLDPQDDYPDYLGPLGAKVAGDHGSFGIGIGASGQGEAMTVNRIKGARAAVYYGGPKDIITLSREHNDANVLSLGARFLSNEEAKEAVWTWLNTPFSNEERHIRRIKKLGFSLIELMVIIAIIGVLASIILPSLSGSRGSTKNAVIKGYVNDLKLVFDIEGAEVRNYAALKTDDWRTVVGDCSNFTGGNAERAIDVCTALFEATAGCAASPNCLYIGPTNPDSDQTFTIMAYLPSAAQWYCIGSSGRSYTGPANPGGGSWTGEGCFANP